MLLNKSNQQHFVALYAVESNQNGVDSDDNEEYQAVRKISATEEIPDEVKNWLTETFVRTNVIKNIGEFISLIDTQSVSHCFSLWIVLIIATKWKMEEKMKVNHWRASLAPRRYNSILH